ncbi:MAG: hypothetical protein CMC70_01320 [Flavobacteriaceae bacterium]|nr:hypothetical protein [Flavobacteriaceae bacterium]
MRIPHELVYRRTGKVKTESDESIDVNNQQSRNELTDAFNSLDLMLDHEPFVEEKERRNYFSLAPGDFNGSIFKKPDSSIFGVAGGTTLQTALSLSSRHVIDGVRLTNSAESRGALVQLSATSVVVFRSCVFERSGSSNAPVWVTVANGGKAVFIGCMFLGSGTGGSIITNAGAAANVQVVGCYNGTGIAFAGVTSAALGNI